jgi:hypothetical protein
MQSCIEEIPGPDHVLNWRMDAMDCGQTVTGQDSLWPRRCLFRSCGKIFSFSLRATTDALAIYPQAVSAVSVLLSTYLGSDCLLACLAIEQLLGDQVG